MAVLAKELNEFLDNLPTAELKFEAKALTPVSFAGLTHKFDIMEEVNDEELLQLRAGIQNAQEEQGKREIQDAQQRSFV